MRNDSIETGKKFVVDHHDNVMRDMRTIQSAMESLGKDLLNFEETPYKHRQNGQEYPMDLMDRNAFSTLEFGFIGE